MVTTFGRDRIRELPHVLELVQIQPQPRDLLNDKKSKGRSSRGPYADVLTGRH